MNLERKGKGREEKEGKREGREYCRKHSINGEREAEGGGRRLI